MARECKPGGYFSNPGLLVWPHSNPANGSQMEVWLARYLDDSRRSVPVLQKRQLKQQHMSTSSC